MLTQMIPQTVFDESPLGSIYTIFIMSWGITHTLCVFYTFSSLSWLLYKVLL